MGRLIDSRFLLERSSAELMIQVFDPAFSISELLPEIFYFLMPSSLAFAELRQLIGAIYSYVKRLFIRVKVPQWPWRGHAPRSKHSLRFAWGSCGNTR